MICHPCREGLHDDCDDVTHGHEYRSCPCLHRSPDGRWVDRSLLREVSE